VAERVGDVMPFDLQGTSHVFTKSRNGGLQQVLVRNPRDTAQLQLVRSHLREIAARFQQGDFSAPTQIHGEDMPGLAQLKQAKPGEISIHYRDLSNGAQIRYATSNPALLVLGSMGIFLWELRHGAALEAARTAALNTLVVGEIAYLFNCRRIDRPALDREGLSGSAYALLAVSVLAVLQLLLTYLPAMQSAFGTAALDLAAWGRIVLFGVLLLLVVEAEKWLFRQWSRLAVRTA
jgi:hypothetical protein